MVTTPKKIRVALAYKRTIDGTEYEADQEVDVLRGVASMLVNDGQARYVAEPSPQEKPAEDAPAINPPSTVAPRRTSGGSTATTQIGG